MAGISVAGSDRSVTIKASNGTLSVNERVAVAGAGTILLQSPSQGRDIVVKAEIKSDTGTITLEADGLALLTEGGVITAATPDKITIDAKGNLPPGLSVTFPDLMNGSSRDPSHSIRRTASSAWMSRGIPCPARSSPSSFIPMIPISFTWAP